MPTPSGTATPVRTLYPYVYPYVYPLPPGAHWGGVGGDLLGHLQDRCHNRGPVLLYLRGPRELDPR